MGQFDEQRIDAIGRNGGEGEHYDMLRHRFEESANFDPTPGALTPANYLSLQSVLDRAFAQASSGKGAERHGQGKPFEEQPMQKLIDLYGLGFALGQAGKKMQEAQRMGVEPAVRELLGAINYIAGAIVHIEKGVK